MAVESIGTLYPTKIPALADSADIQLAFRAYHYGSYTFDTAEVSTANLLNPSIAYSLNSLQSQISSISTGIAVSTFNAKGDLLSASANDTPLILSVGVTNGHVLTINSATGTGLSWASPEVTLINSVTLTNKTLTSPIISGLTLSDASIILEGATADAHETTLTIVDPTADRTITFPDATGTVQLFNLNATAKTAAYTLATTDVNTMIQMTGAHAFTVSTNLSGMPVSSQIHLLSTTTGVRVTAGAGTTVRATPGLNFRGAYSSATLIYLGTNEWVLVGDLST